MIRLQNISLSPDERYRIAKGDLITDLKACKLFFAQYLRLPPEALLTIRIVKESIDARKSVSFIITADIEFVDADTENRILKRFKNASVTDISSPHITKRLTHTRPTPVIVGFGPAGIFAALEMVDMGLEPIMLERGAAIQQRVEDVQSFIHHQLLNSNSNIQYGEGGAGTFSDAKLSTGIKSDAIRHVLETFVRFGAPESILYKAMPHIGTDIIRRVVVQIRKHLLNHGVKISFRTTLEDIETENKTLQGIVVRDNALNQTRYIPCTKLLLCIGHSARDTVEMLYNKGVEMVSKPFAIGVRIEHLQQEVNRSRYHEYWNHPAMPRASYNLNVKTPDGRGLYSFCMCPGGEVVLASSEHSGIVVNGMSYYARDAQNANSALLVGIRPEDFNCGDPLAGFSFQRSIEQRAYESAGNQYLAPVQTVGSLLGKTENRISSISPSCKNGYSMCKLETILPAYVLQNLKYGLPLLAKQMRCFGNLEAVLSGVETRSSSPVRILRSECGETSIKGIYGAGEGAGFSGGIMSSSIDGIKISRRMYGEAL